MTEPSTRASHPEHFPDDFADAGALIRSLIATRSNRNDRLDQVDVRDAIETIGRHAQNGLSQPLRLEATSLLGKASETFNSKALTTLINSIANQALIKPLPPIGDWGNADDRKYLARAVVLSDAAWIPLYAAEALAHAEINEKVSRDIWAELAITRTSDLATALRSIARATAQWLSVRDDSSELAYRKLKRVCEALAQTLLTADVPSGSKFGDAFLELVRIAGGGRGAEVVRLREEAGIGILDLVIQVLRLRFDVVFDSSIYRAVGTVRNWWRPARPPEEVEHRADRIAQLAMQGLQILARQGVRDKELRLALTKSLDSARVNSVGQAVADADISLDPASSKFLATGQDLLEVRSNKTIQEINDQAVDALVGRLLLTIVNQDVTPDALTSVADAIDLFEPAQATLVRQASRRLELVRQWTDALADKRRLATYASRGELVQYDPALHDTGETLRRLIEVRIAVPGVVRAVEGSPSTIIIKAIVEKA